VGDRALAMGTFFFDERLIDDEQRRIDNEVDAFTLMIVRIDHLSPIAWTLRADA